MAYIDRGRPECRTTHEPEPEEAEERPKFAAEKGAVSSGVRPGGCKVACVSGSAAGVIASNGVLFERHN